MKEAIVKYLRLDRSYSGGVALVMKYSHRIGFKRMLNVQHETSYLLGIIHEELRELAGLTNAEMKRIMSIPVVKQTTSETSSPETMEMKKVSKGSKSNKTTAPSKGKKDKPTTKVAAKSSKKASRKK
jgi:hypothetical protein